MRTLFVTDFHPFITRNLIDSGVLDMLATHFSKVVIFTTKSKGGLLRERVTTSNIEIVPVDMSTAVSRRRNIFFLRLAEMLLDTKTQKFHQMIYRVKSGKWAKYFFARSITFTFHLLPWIRPLFRRLEMSLNPSSGILRPFFHHEKPDLVFSTDLFDPWNIDFLKEAALQGIENVGMVRSWDNTSTKEYLRIVPSKIIVQNELMRDELAQYHDVDPRRVICSGVPQFEKYLKYQPTSREKFCRSINVNPSKKIILYSPAGKLFTDTDWQVCEMLKEIHDEQLVPADVHFLIRPHPQNAPDLTRFTPSDAVSIDWPQVVKTGEGRSNLEFSPYTMDHLADTLFHSEILVNVVSSIIVEAAIFDKPIITVAFDGWEKGVPFTRSVERLHAEEWPAKTFLEVTPFVRSKQELADWITRYLEHPSLDREKRAAFVRNHCYKFDGRSAERIVAAVISCSPV